MSKALYVVILSREKWWVDFEGKAHGPHTTKDAATDEGRQLARICAHSGRESEVLVPDETGRYRVVWDSLNEPHAGSDYLARRGGSAEAGRATGIAAPRAVPSAPSPRPAPARAP
jgi:hypothetical protein